MTELSSASLVAARQPDARRRRRRAGVRREPARRPRGRGPVLGAPRGHARARPRRRARDGRPGRLRLDRGQRGLARPRRLGRRTAQQSRTPAAPSATRTRSTTSRGSSTTATAIASCSGRSASRRPRGTTSPCCRPPGSSTRSTRRSSAASTSRSTSTASTRRSSRRSRRGPTRPSTRRRPPSTAAARTAIANFNVENLYDYRDDPFDGCDFTGNAGCPGVSPPFDYVPASQAAYDEHLGALASEVANDLHGPDLLLVQEAEDQDICTVCRRRAPVRHDEQRRRQAGHAPGARAPDRRARRPGVRRGLRPQRRRRPRDRRRVPLPHRPRPAPAGGGGRPGARLDAGRDVSRRRARVQRRRLEPEGAQRRAAGRRRHLDRRGRVERLHAGAAGRALPRVAQRRRARRVGRPLRGVATTSRPARTPASGSGPSRRATAPRSSPRSRRPTRRHGSSRAAT